MYPSRRKFILSAIISIILLIAAGFFGTQIKIFSFEFIFNFNLNPSPNNSNPKSPISNEKPTEKLTEKQNSEPSPIISAKTETSNQNISTSVALSKEEINHKLQSQPIDIQELLQINEQRFSNNFYYIAHIPSYDAKQTRYILSSSHDEKHLLAFYLKNPNNSNTYLFKLDNCNQQICNTQKQGNSFASFNFNSSPNFKKGEMVKAKCDYENIYRREYENYTEIELSFKNCT